QLVLDDAATDGVAELVAGEDALRNTVGIVVEAIGSERRNAVELVERTMERVRAGFGRYVDDAAGCAPVLSREVAGNDAELLDCVERHALPDDGCERVDVLAAIKQDVGRSRALAVNRKAGAAPAGHGIVR